MSNWGKAHENNTIGFGQGSANNSIGWGSIYDKSYSGDTVLNPSLNPFEDATVAYSLRDLGLGTTNVVKVRRSTDNAEQDFTANEITDGTLTSFCGAGDGFVSVWYDQTGVYDASQTSASTQPKIVDAGSVILENGKPSIQFNGINSSMLASGFGTLPERIVFTVMKSIGDGNGYENYWIFKNANTTGDFMQIFSLDTNSSLRANYPVNSLDINEGIAVNTQTLVTAAKTLSGTTLRQNGVTTGTGTGAQDLEDVLSIGKFSINYAYYNLQEMIVFNDDKTIETTDIETNINNHYAIY